jgi:intergrase/recombinase
MQGYCNIERKNTISPCRYNMDYSKGVKCTFPARRESNILQATKK